MELQHDTDNSIDPKKGPLYTQVTAIYAYGELFYVIKNNIKNKNKT